MWTIAIECGFSSKTHKHVEDPPDLQDSRIEIDPKHDSPKWELQFLWKHIVYKTPYHTSDNDDGAGKVKSWFYNWNKRETSNQEPTRV